MAQYPSAVISFTSKNSGDVIQPSHINTMQDEITAIEDGLLNGTAPLNSSRITAPASQITASTVTNLTATNSTATNLSATNSTTTNLSVTNSTVSGSINLTGGQVAFPAAQNASAGANTLDDYEEGSFTPALKFGGANTGMTTSAATGTYVKVGQTVYFTLRLTLTAKGSSTGAATITGLPFTSGSLFSVIGSIYFFNLGTAIASAAGYIGGSATSISLVSVAAAGSVDMVNMTEASFANNSDLIVSGCYRASA